MNIEQLVDTLIILHASGGGLALLSGAIALIAKKGSQLHVKTGKVFFWSMLSSAILAFLIAVSPGHESPFLFSVGIFSTYFLLGGFWSVQLKRKEVSLLKYKVLAYVMIIAGLTMAVFPFFLYGKMNVVLLVFGLVGAVFGYRDLQLFKDREKVQKSWLNLHLGKMTGGYIAAISAFLVVNQILPGLWNWFLPGILGGFYINFESRKLKK